MEVRSCDLGGARRCSRSDVEDVVRRSSVCVSVTSVMRGWRLLVSLSVVRSIHSFRLCLALAHTLSSPNLINNNNNIIIIIPTPESLPNH